MYIYIYIRVKYYYSGPDIRKAMAQKTLAPQHFRRRLQQLTRRFSAAGLLGSEGFLGHSFPYIRSGIIILDTNVNVNIHLRFSEGGLAYGHRNPSHRHRLNVNCGPPAAQPAISPLADRWDHFA